MKKKHKGSDFVYKNQIRQLFLVMKLVSFIVFIGALSLSASSYSQKARIDLDIQNSTVQDIIHSIESNSEFIFVYDAVYIHSVSNRSISVRSKAISEVLDQLFQGTGVSYVVDDRQIFLYNSKDLSTLSSPKAILLLAEQPQKIEIKGAVKDNNGLPLPGVTVVIKGTTIGTISQADGSFTFFVPADTKTIVFSFVGMKTQEILISGRTTFNIVMKEEAVQLNEVVAVGYGITTTREKLTGSISTIQEKQLSDRPTTSPLTLLKGLATGVRITTNTSIPGSTPGIQVREVSSWKGGSGVLFVIDGVVRDIDSFQALNPEDIASVSVLKDAASAAIYGMKAGDGVLLVTTKNGESGKTKFSYGYSYSSSNPVNLVHKLNAYDYASRYNMWLKMIGKELSSSDYYLPYELDYFKTHSYDAVDDFWSNPVLQNHNVAARGGNEKIKYFVSGSFNTSDQSSIGIQYEKYTVRAKMDAKMTNRLTFSFNISASWDKNVRPNYNNGDETGNLQDSFGNMSYGSLLTQQATNPFVKVIDGVIYPTNTTAAQFFLGQGGNQTFNNTYVNPMASLKYSIPGVQGLTASVQYAYNNRFSKNKLWRVTPFTYNFTRDRHIVTDNFNYAAGWKNRGYMQNQTTAGLSQTYSSNYSYQGNYQLSYSHSFGLHNVSSFIGYEFRGSKGDYISASRYGFALESYNQISGGSSDINNQKTSGDITGQDGMASWIGRLDYDFNGKYLLGITMRRDGSYKFAPNQRWGNFPAFSAAWNASKESFFEPLKSVFNTFKIRGSWGITGNDNTNAWQWRDAMLVGGNQTFGSEISPTLTTSVVPNPSITWEKNNNYNIGLDLGFLNNALTFTAEGWFKRTTDILSNRIATTPYVFGVSLPDVNYGIASAQGVEFSANFHQKIGEVSFSVGGNISHSVNKIILKDQPAGTRPYDNENGQPMNRIRVWQILVNRTGDGVIRSQAEASLISAENGVGASNLAAVPGAMFALDFRGSNNTIFADIPDGSVDVNGNNDKVFLPGKYSSPRLVYGLNANLQWKGLELNMVAAGTGVYWRTWDRGLTAQFDRFQDFWPNEWTPNNINGGPSPIYAVGGGWPAAGTDKPSSYNTYNMSYLRMKNMSLGYTVPTIITRKIGIEGVKFYMNIENPFTFFKKCPGYMDPESAESVNYPLLRSYSFGVNLTI